MKKFLSLFAAVVFSAHVSLAAGGWTDNYEKAVAQAKAEKKLVLLDFTGSDWCGWCMKLDKEVFQKSDFKNFARENLVPVTVDFPHGKKLSKKTADQNAKLKSEHGVSGFPTIVLLNADGKVINKWGGYSEKFLEELKAKVAEAKSK
jgi:thioredoxin-related protein